MLTRRGAFALVFVGVFAVSTSLYAQGRGAASAQPKLSDAQRKDMLAIAGMVDANMAGQAGPNDLALTWAHDDLLKATNNREYVPFTVTIDPSKVTGGTVQVYWRVVSKEQAAAMAAMMAPAAGGKDAKKDDKKAAAARPQFSYEDIGTAPITATSGKLSRSFTVTAGTYDVYVLVKEPTSDKKGAPAPKMALIKQTVVVPELWGDELNTSSVIVAERIDPLPAPLTSAQMIERPYALGAMEIVPVMTAKLSKKVELSPFLLIYNAKTDSANKPDVTVEYNFYAKDAKEATGEKFFNKTEPQALDAKTLPPQFDFAAGHQLQSGQAIPLASFPEGDYRLEIKVTDKIANKTVTRNLNFTVSGS